MIEPRGELDLAKEAVRARGASQIGMQDLERDRPVVSQVLREVNRRHAAAAELALDGVAVGEGLLKTGEQVGHDGTPH